MERPYRVEGVQTSRTRRGYSTTSWLEPDPIVITDEEEEPGNHTPRGDAFAATPDDDGPAQCDLPPSRLLGCLLD